MEFTEIFSRIFYFIILIGVLVFIHELGHFLAAKLFKMRVERFSIGFPPRAFGRKIGETDYCVSWIPIGGYVKISGMIDESLDLEHMNKKPEPWEFRAKPIWQRMIVISAGVIFNVLLAVGIFWGINLSTGKVYHDVTTVGAVQPNSAAAIIGFQPGDKILSINGKTYTTWEELEPALQYEAMSSALEVTVLRNGQTITLTRPQGELPDLTRNPLGLLPAGLMAKIQWVEDGKPASIVGLQPGDVLLEINGTPVYTTYDVIREISAHPNETIAIKYRRGNEETEVRVTPNDDGKIGISITNVFEAAKRVEKYSVFGALNAGVKDLYVFTMLYVDTFSKIISGEVSFSSTIGGPIRIAEMADQAAQLGIVSFLGTMAVLSLSLALINIFPFPALDGGHLFFLIYEAIFRREVPNILRIRLQQAGMVLLLLFMGFIVYNDIFH